MSPRPDPRALRWETDGRGIMRAVADVSGMSFPVQCQCGQIYDLGKVTVTARYADCSVWKTPCCNITTDDRPGGLWGGRRTYTELTRDGRAKR